MLAISFCNYLKCSSSILCKTQNVSLPKLLVRESLLDEEALAAESQSQSVDLG